MSTPSWLVIWKNARNRKRVNNYLHVSEKTSDYVIVYADALCLTLLELHVQRGRILQNTWDKYLKDIAKDYEELHSSVCFNVILLLYRTCYWWPELKYL